MADCPKCGEFNPAGTPLCRNCGASLDLESAPEETAVVPDQPAGEPDDEVMKLLRSGSKIAAIKVYREQTGVGLKEAKEAVEAMASEHGISPAPSGCSGVVLAAILLGSGLAAWIC